MTSYVKKHRKEYANEPISLSILHPEPWFHSFAKSPPLQLIFLIFIARVLNKIPAAPSPYKASDL